MGCEKTNDQYCQRNEPEQPGHPHRPIARATLHLVDIVQRHFLCVEQPHAQFVEGVLQAGIFVQASRSLCVLIFLQETSVVGGGMGKTIINIVALLVGDTLDQELPESFLDRSQHLWVG
ncbi:hypothetical protein D3C85_1063310 [compost metagenome]